MSFKPRRKHALRLVVTTTALAAALSAHAWIISAAGTTNNVGVIQTVDYKFSNLAGINAATYTFGVSFNTGTGAFSGNFVDGVNFLNVANNAGNVSLAANTYSFSGIWNLVGTNLNVLPTGTYSATFDLNTQRYEFNVAGAVPEPASMAALGVGAVALIRRRRRS